MHIYLFYLFNFLNQRNQKDKQLQESACLCISRIVDNLSSDTSKMEELTKLNLLDNIFLLVQTHPAPVGDRIFTMVLRILSAISRRCPQLVLQMHKLKAAQAIRGILDSKGGGETDGVRASGSMFGLPIEQMAELVQWMCELLPSEFVCVKGNLFFL